MVRDEWQRRIERAEELGAQHDSATEMLRFYSAVAFFQRMFYFDLERLSSRPAVVASKIAPEPFAQQLSPELIDRFRLFLELVEPISPQPIQEAALELREAGEGAQFHLLTVCWDGNESGVFPPGPHDFFARALLQPYAASLREHANLHWTGPTPFLCPFCARKPGLGVLRPLGDGGQRSLVCSFCLAEWEFRRIVCPGCGEEDHAKLPVYTAEEFKHVRVDACDSCRSYIKTVDMTKNGLAEPIVDEMAATALDLWARGQGYSKLQCNLLQL